MSDTHEKLIASIRFHTVARFAIQAISWVGTVCVLRMVDEHALGTFAIASVVFGYASLMYEGGLLEALVQRPPQTSSARRSVFTLLLTSSLAAAAVLFAISQPVAAFVDAPAVSGFIRLLGVTLILTALGILPQAELMREMKFGRLGIISSLQALFATVTTVVVASRGGGAWSLVFGTLAGAATRTLLLQWALPRLYWPTLRMREALDYLRTSGQLIADGLLWRWYTSIDVILLGRWAGTGQLGHYSFAQQIANMPLEKISTVVNDVALPAYAELAHRRRRVTTLVLEIVRMHAIIGLPIFWGIASVAVVAVPLVFGEQWRPAVFPLIAFALVAPIRLIGSVETPAMTAVGRADVLLRTKALIVPCMTVAVGVGCWVAGVEGAALAWLTIFPACYSLAFRWVLQTLDTSFADLLAVIRGPVLAAAGMAASVAALEPLLRHLAGPTASLAMLIATGGALYPALLRMVDRTGFDLAWSRGRRLLLPGQ